MHGIAINLNHKTDTTEHKEEVRLYTAVALATAHKNWKRRERNSGYPESVIEIGLKLAGLDEPDEC